MAEFSVIGMGRFGRAVARALVREGQSVLAVDRDLQRLEKVAADVDAVASADTTDQPSVAALQLDRMTSVVVAIGSRATEASLLTVAILRELGVPHIVGRAFDERHARLLLAVGANEVLIPEDVVGHRLASSLAHPGIGGEIPIGPVTVAVVEAPESLAGRRPADLGDDVRLGVTLLALGRPGEEGLEPPAEREIAGGDRLLVAGSPEAVRALATLK